MNANQRFLQRLVNPQTGELTPISLNSIARFEKSTKHDQGYFNLVIQQPGNFGKKFRMKIGTDNILRLYDQHLTKSVDLFKVNEIDILHVVDTYLIRSLIGMFDDKLSAAPFVQQDPTAPVSQDPTAPAPAPVPPDQDPTQTQQGGGRTLTNYQRFMKTHLAGGRMTMKQAAALWRTK